jgi:hypothetical protein
MQAFVQGGLTFASLTAALLFLRFWRLTAERLFFFFALAFCAFAVNWLALGLIAPTWEQHYYVFLPRLAGFAFIILGILDKNRRLH